MNDNKKTAVLEIERKEEKVLDISHKIWEYAELSLKEYRSAELYIEALKEEGFDVREELCGIKTAFSGSFGSGRPYIGILAEFDALSGLSQEGCSTEKKTLQAGGSGHGCGHNMLGAASFGAALGVKKFLEETGMPGTVIFYGCPGEEGGASKALMARDGVWKELDAAITWHPGDTNEVSTGTCNSCIQALYSFEGIASHAAGNPEAGRSALDAAELMNVGVQFLREHVNTDVRVHYSFIDAGGVSPNVVQPTATVLYMMRSIKVKDTLELERRIDKIAEGAALMTETTVKKTFVDGCSNELPNHTLEKLLYENMEEVGVPSYTEDELSFAKTLKNTYISKNKIPGMGSQQDPLLKKESAKLSDNGTKVLNDFLVPRYEGYYFEAGSTDVGDVSWLTPTAQFNAVCFPSECPGHSWQNVSCGVSSIGDKGVMYAAKVLACSAVDLFTRPDVLKKAKEEFDVAAEDGYYCPVPEGAELYVL